MYFDFSQIHSKVAIIRVYHYIPLYLQQRPGVRVKIEVEAVGERAA